MSKQKRRVKGKTVDFNEFVSQGGGLAPGFTLVQKKNIDWADDSSSNDLGPICLPTAPIASRGGLIDESKVPLDPPYVAFLGNLPFEIAEEEVEGFFKELRVTNVRLVRDGAERFKGFGYVEFADRQSLIKGLELDGEPMRNREVKVGLPDENESGRRDNQRSGGGFGSRGERQPERDLPSDWRAAARDEQSSRGNSYKSDRFGGGGGYNDRGDRGGFGDRGGGSDNRDWRDRGSENRGSNRYEPPRDRNEYSSSSSAPAERPKLNLAPRTKPIEAIKVTAEAEEPPKVERPKIEKPKPADIFGAAKPVDTAAKLREIEKRLEEKKRAELEELKQREEEAQKSRTKEDNVPRNQNKTQPINESDGRSWREEIREEKDKKDQKKVRSERRAPAGQLDEKPFVVSSQNKFAGLEESENNQQSEEGDED